MNVPEEYDDEVERRHTPSYLLPTDEPDENHHDKTIHLVDSMSLKQPMPVLHHCRSVLMDEKHTDNGKTVTWEKSLPTRGNRGGDVDRTSRWWSAKVRQVRARDKKLLKTYVTSE